MPSLDPARPLCTARDETLLCIRKRDVAMRAGGKEFVVMLCKRAHAECEAEMEAPRARIEALCPANVEATVSIGAATNLDGRDIDLNKILVRADSAMYRAKTAGRNRVIFAETDHSRVEWN